MYAKLRCGGNLPLCLAFGTGEGHLRYGICVPCSKQPPGVRDASSEEPYLPPPPENLTKK